MGKVKYALVHSAFTSVHELAQRPKREPLVFEHVRTIANLPRVEGRVEVNHKKDAPHRNIKFLRIASRILLLVILSSILSFAHQQKLRKPDVPYEPTPQNVVDLMLKLANVHKGDVVYDLGCGDGRIVITAIKNYGATGVGIDIDPIRIAESVQNARLAGVMDRAIFRNEDLYEADIRNATVVALFLWRAANLKLRPKLLRDLRPGTRVVSYYWDMDDWVPDKRIEVAGNPIYIWTIPDIKGPNKEY